MFVLRSINQEDLEDLYELSGKVTFINLPHDKEVIKSKIAKSIKSFKKPHKLPSENYYFFALEDTSIQKVVGVSMVHAQHGTEEEPHFFLSVSNEHKYSKTINTGFVHGMLKLGLDTNGPTEIGGLVVDPTYRGNPFKLGKQISFVRFLYMAANPQRFQENILSELMPPLDKDGNSPLWEGLGRRFMNMDYQQADQLSRNNKEFILSLFPANNIYMTLLTPEARNAIGQVGNETKPVKKMLEGIGFKYSNEVDPFDGGPHYKAKREEISLIKDFQISTLVHKSMNRPTEKKLITFKHTDHEFFSVFAEVEISGEKIFLAAELVAKFKLNAGDIIKTIPFQ